ncbi:hypothetical protein [Bacteroides nordii]|uniref:hypothetical protein n=1 Tax=Bacteroides nordii TaxID=291645 RepID=UPI003522E88D
MQQKKSNKPENFKRLYHLVSQVKKQDESMDTDRFIQGWIWQSTNERTYRKSELSMSEYENICNEIEKKYGLKKLRHRNSTGVNKDDDKIDRARKRLMAAVHENMRLKHKDKLEGYQNSPNNYVIGIIMRHSGGDYDNFNKIPYARLLGIYSYYLEENKLLRHEV